MSDVNDTYFNTIIEDSADEDTYVDIIEADLKCGCCRRKFRDPFFGLHPYPGNGENPNELHVDFGVFERFLGYLCPECQEIPYTVDIIMACHGLCFLSDYATSYINNRMLDIYDRVSPIAYWNGEEWELNYYTIPNSSTKPLFGEDLERLVSGFSLTPHCNEIRPMLKQQPREVLEVFWNLGVPPEKCPYRKLKVRKYN